MSNRYKGGIISATPPTTTGGDTGTASGAWTLEQQMQAQAAGNWPIQPPPNYIENVFSTWLYTGTGATQTLPVGVNVNGFGGLELIKGRSQNANANPSGAAGRWFAFSKQNATSTELAFYDGGTSTAGVGTVVTAPLWFLPGGNNLISGDGLNTNGATYVSWTFRKQPKFFDVVTWSGNSVSGRQIPHSLGSIPGCILVKVTSVTGSWFVWHRSMGGNNFYQTLNSPDPRTNGGAPYWNNTAPTSTVFTVGNDSDINQTGRTYVAYLFAHDAGGFGLTETDNVISCGSYTGNGSGTGPVVTLGYEPQWLMVKAATRSSDWFIVDNMRGFSQTANRELFPNLGNAEDTAFFVAPTATGFQPTATSALVNESGQTYIYVAIRRGPMAVPTTGTSVFVPATRTGTGSNTTVTTSVSPVDLLLSFNTSGLLGQGVTSWDRLRGANRLIITSSTAAEQSPTDTVTGFDVQNGYTLGADVSGYGPNYSGLPFINFNFKRAPGFFDEVCYTGNGTAGAAWNHNLGVAPELIIVKQRSTSAGTRNWISYSATTGINQYLYLNTTDAASSLSGVWHTAPTASVFYTNNFAEQNTSGSTYVAYLFASCPGVSKVGSYTGTGTTQTINCGFTGGARFVMIKRTDSTGDWYVWDTARGMIPANDPYLLLNSTAAQVTGTDFVDTTSVGFEITSTAPAAINANGGTFIFLAIA
jgi:hypothetical protein